MKAILLAAGKGTRLKPYTDRLSKCLIPINGKPLLSIWLELLARHGIDSVLINTHHHARQVERYVETVHLDSQPHVTLFHEPRLLGSAGTVWANREYVAAEEDFLIAYADNLTDVDLSTMFAFHRKKHRSARSRAKLTMGLFRTPTPEACGIAELDDDDLITAFTEKPTQPRSNLANAGIYIASTAIFEAMKPLTGSCAQNGADAVFDFGFQVLPALVGQMYGYKIETYLKDIGTPESYYLAQKQWPGEKLYAR